MFAFSKIDAQFRLCVCRACSTKTTSRNQWTGEKEREFGKLGENIIAHWVTLLHCGWLNLILTFNYSANEECCCCCICRDLLKCPWLIVGGCCCCCCSLVDWWWKLHAKGRDDGDVLLVMHRRATEMICQNKHCCDEESSDDGLPAWLE